MSVLTLKNVFKDYKLENKSKFTALQDINVSFDKGELVSIIGESGSGKSTLMNLIGGLDSDYTGLIEIDGKDLKSFSSKNLDDYRKKKIGFVFQSFNLIPHLSVIDNVTIALTLSNEKESVKVAKATKILERLGLQEHLKKKPSQLSGGQKQRVAIARALINDPDIILADEPTGALDSATTLQILEILKEIADEGKLVIMVTHSEKVASISSRIVEISDGKIASDQKQKGYKKGKKFSEEEQKENIEKKEKHLSWLSAFKLSLHSMWASKTKNFLMAFGVSISLIAMITMLAFGSGLTGYINSLAKSYSSTDVVTISKRTQMEEGSQGVASMFAPNQFTDEEISSVIDDVNNYLQSQNNDFRADINQNVDYGFSIMTGFSQSAQVTLDGEEPITQDIFYLYTTPPYYDENQMLAGTIPTSNVDENNVGEVMFSDAIVKALGFESREDAIDSVVTLKVSISGMPEITRQVKITGIVDVSVFENMLVMYVDFDYLANIVAEETLEENGQATTLMPTSLYITTDSEDTTNLINSYLQTRDDLTGSVEDQLANMFSQMMSTFSIALAVIAGISLLVSLIMILVVMYMSVSERTKEIGVLKSIGARGKDIKKIFTAESIFIGLLSGICGTIFSLVFGGILAIIFTSTIGFAPISYEWYYFIGALVISVLISTLAGLYPASKAAKLDPVESLRHE